MPLRNRRMRQYQQKAKLLHAFTKRQREQRATHRQRQKDRNLRPRHPVASRSRCATEEDAWNACSPEVQCHHCTRTFKSLHKTQLAVQPSHIHGDGIFLKARRGIEKETIITLVKGRRFSNYDQHTNYSYALTKGFIEPKGLARYVNHAPSPNSRIQKWYHGDTENLAIVSIQRIEYNQEITVDYRDHLRRFDK